MAVLLVILLLSVTLGLSYALVRSENTAMQIARNYDLRGRARQAAMSGMTMAIKKMHTTGWAGVSSTLTGTLSTLESFSVTYTAGDSTLTSTSADYKEYPYRVTLLSTGRAVDPADASRSATHRIRAVVRLVPRKLADEPSDWQDACTYTVFQHSLGAISAAVPFRISGKVRCNGPLWLAHDYDWSDTARQYFLTGLNQMRLAGSPDYRPFDGPIAIPYWWQESGLVSLLSSMGVSTSNSTAVLSSSLPYWSSSTYRLYPGGPTYNVQYLPADCDNQSWTPDPQTNPLGYFVRGGSVRLYDNVTIQGTIATRASSNADVEIYGSNVQVLPVDLPPLYGSNVPIRLPVIDTDDDVRIHANARGAIRGLITVRDTFDVEADQQADIQVTLAARIITQNIYIHARDEWNRSSGWWNARQNGFENQPTGGTPYFPVYLQNSHGLDSQPRILVKPETAQIRYHWNTLQNPIYAAEPSDGGLRWDLLQWADAP